MLAQLPLATRYLIISNVAIFAAQGLLNLELLSFALWPLGTYFAPWQVITYAFLHGGLAHLALNLLAVYMFGGRLEAMWGTRRFIIFYFASVLAAAGAQLAVTAASGALYPTVGASGGVFGLLLAFALYFPRERILLLFPPIPLPAWLFVTLYGIFELVLGMTRSNSGVAHFAHLGGMLGGAATLLFWRLQGTRTSRRF
jgi:membrane associated rhomboid family serine protease